MIQKVICDHVGVCKEEKFGCNHAQPHEIEVWQKYKSTDMTDCTCQDSCNDFRAVRCIPFCLDFEIEELFLL